MKSTTKKIKGTVLEISNDSQFKSISCSIPTLIRTIPLNEICSFPYQKIDYIQLRILTMIVDVNCTLEFYSTGTLARKIRISIKKMILFNLQKIK